MKDAKNILQAQVDSLVTTLKQYQVEQLDTRLDEAGQRAAAIVAAAYSRARESMRAAIEEHRKRTAQRARILDMRIAHAERLARQRRSLALLGQSRAFLSDALQRRWQQSGTQSVWCEAAIARAAGIFRGTEWTVEYPAAPGDAPELPGLEAMLSARGIAAKLAANAEFSAGLRLCCDGVVMDATLDGLLSDSESVSALLLAALEGLEP